MTKHFCLTNLASLFHYFFGCCSCNHAIAVMFCEAPH